MTNLHTFVNVCSRSHCGVIVDGEWSDHCGVIIDREWSVQQWYDVIHVYITSFGDSLSRRGPHDCKLSSGCVDTTTEYQLRQW